MSRCVHFQPTIEQKKREQELALVQQDGGTYDTLYAVPETNQRNNVDEFNAQASESRTASTASIASVYVTPLPRGEDRETVNE